MKHLHLMLNGIAWSDKMDLFLTYFKIDGSYLQTERLKTDASSKVQIIKEITALRNKGNLPNTKKKNIHIFVESEPFTHLIPFKKRITTASAKGKGRTCQNWTAQKISDLLGLPWGKDEQIAAREMGQSGTDIRLVADAKDLFPWSIEAKNCETWSVPAFIKQAKENQGNSTDWLVVMKKNNHEYIVVLDAEVFFDLLRLLRGSKKGR